MRISIFGLGYVGAVCAGCLSARGHEVIGVDVSSTKIDLINQGKSPIVEPGLEALLQQGRQTGRLSGTTDFKKAVLDSDVSFICVGTPSKKNGDLDLATSRPSAARSASPSARSPNATPWWCAAPYCRAPSTTW